MKFKSLLAALAISTLLSIPVQAQDEMDTRHEVGISYGTIPNTKWFDVYTDIIPSIFGETRKTKNYVGPIGLEYYYHTSSLIGVGAVAVFASNDMDSYYENVQSSHITRNYFSFMPSVKFNWLRKNHWGLYSKLAAGVTYAYFNDEDYDENGKKTGDKSTAKDLLFNFQASLIGVEAGGQHLRGFAEFGIGEQGVALAGIRYKF